MSPFAPGKLHKKNNFYQITFILRLRYFLLLTSQTLFSLSKLRAYVNFDHATAVHNANHVGYV